MNSKWIAALLVASAVPLSGCQTMPTVRDTSESAPQLVRTQLNHSLHAAGRELPHEPLPSKSEAKENIRSVNYQELDYGRPASNTELIAAEVETGLEDSSSTVGNQQDDLSRFEQMALEAHPGVQELVSQIESLQGKQIQAGLPPNPNVGFNAEDINEDGGAGRYGVFFGREIVRGNKLGIARSVVCAEIQAAQQQLSVMEQRLQTDVRQRYYDVLVAQEKIKFTKELVAVFENALEMSNKLLAAKESARTSVLQIDLELQNALVVQRQAENQLDAARRRLAALLGEEDLPLDQIQGDPRELIELESFESSFDQLIADSPEVAALFADVERRKRQLARECVEPIPNITWQTTLQYDTVSDDLVSGFQVGMPIPTLNQNQGAIHQARHQVMVAERRVEKKVLELRQRLATAFENYVKAKLQIDAYDRDIIPRASETLTLVTQGYEQGEIDFIQLLTAQRTYSQINLTYLNQLQQLWQQNANIRGLLLNGSLFDR